MKLSDDQVVLFLETGRANYVKIIMNRRFLFAAETLKNRNFSPNFKESSLYENGEKIFFQIYTLLARCYILFLFPSYAGSDVLA